MNHEERERERQMRELHQEIDQLAAALHGDAEWLIDPLCVRIAGAVLVCFILYLFLS